MRLDRHYHVCTFFRSRDEEYRVLGPFYKEGLEWGEKVVNLCDAAFRHEHLARLAQLGIDVEGCHDRGQLLVQSWDDCYLAHGRFDPDRMLQFFDDASSAASAEGYSRLRGMGNMDWALSNPPGADQLIEYEIRLNEVVGRHKCLVICVYDLTRLPGATVMDILRCHPLVLIDRTVNENPFYTPPGAFLEEIRARRYRDPDPAHGR
ncbi:MEDS domain-containing protein [Polyangium jinanense]|uniref:MEDS domain-containing protein n=2 Tax=Polyangium jinanense TaxID=2829994 RepID=A0A9X4AX98_9BACT|nr:MEDS domain-containing protein [Polyangium jinanense]